MLFLSGLPEMRDSTEEAVPAHQDHSLQKTAEGGFMKNGMLVLLLMAAIFLKGSTTDAQPPDFLWAARGGGAGLDLGRSIATDDSGNIIVTGEFSSTAATFGDTTLTCGGDWCMFIVKYDEVGDFLWAVGADATDDVIGRGIAADDSGNVIVIGSFEDTATVGDTTLITPGDDDIFIAKYDRYGHFVWAAQAGGEDYDHGNSIATDDSGNVIVAGEFWSTAATFGDTTLINAGGCDIFIAKYDKYGHFVWAVQAGGASSDYGWDIDTDPSGNIVVTGRFAGSATFGDTTLFAAGARDMFVAKYDTAGTFLWAARAGGTGLTEGHGIAADGSGNSIVTGEFSNTATFGDSTLVAAGIQEDIFIAKYDSAGDFLWVAQAGGTGSDLGFDIATDDSGNGILTGYFSSTPATFGDTTLTSVGNWDIFIAKYDAAGGFFWVAQAGGIYGDFGQGIATDGSGNSFATGSFTSAPATFGDTTLTSAGEYDIFVAKLGVGVTGIEGEFIQPRSLELLQNHPNPFNHATSLRFWVADLGMVSLKVYDISGREIRTLVSEQKQPGTHAVLWDGRSDGGLEVPSGVYFSKLQAGSFVQTRKMLLLR